MSLKRHFLDSETNSISRYTSQIVQSRRHSPFIFSDREKNDTRLDYFIMDAAGCTMANMAVIVITEISANEERSQRTCIWCKCSSNQLLKTAGLLLSSGHQSLFNLSILKRKFVFRKIIDATNIVSVVWHGAVAFH